MTTDRIMKLMEKIDSELLDYRTRIDNLVEAHNGAKSAAEQECAKMRGKWNDDYIQQYRTEQQKRSIEEAQRKMQQFREKTSQYVQLSMNQLNTEIDKLFNSPIDPDFSRKFRVCASEEAGTGICRVTASEADSREPHKARTRDHSKRWKA